MKPVLAVYVRPESQVSDLEVVTDQINWYLDREYGPTMLNVRLLTTEDDLRAHQAGELVLYRKPARKVGDRYIYERNGERVVLEQERLALE